MEWEGLGGFDKGGGKGVVWVLDKERKGWDGGESGSGGVGRVGEGEISCWEARREVLCLLNAFENAQ